MTINKYTVTYKRDALNVNASQTPFLTFPNGTKYIYQTDGNFVIYDPNNQPQWASHSNRQGDASQLLLRYQDDGNFVTYFQGQGTWQANTATSGVTLTCSDSMPYMNILNGSGNVVWSSGNTKN